MKKLHLLFVAILIAGSAPAQVGKHTVVAGLDFSYESSVRNFYDSNGVKYPDKSTTSLFTVSPNLGFFVSQKVLVGIRGMIGWTEGDDDFHGYVGAHPRSDQKTVTIYARHYSKIGERVYFFLQGDVAWGKSVYQSQRFDSNSGAVISFSETTHFFRTGIRPGIVYFITPKFGLESTIGFFGYTRSYAGNDEFNFQSKNITNTVGLTLNSSTLNFGFRFYFGKRPAEN